MIWRRSLGAALLLGGLLTLDPASPSTLPAHLPALAALLGLGLMVPNAPLLLALVLGLTLPRVDLSGPPLASQLYPALSFGAACGLAGLLLRRFRSAMAYRRAQRQGPPPP
jgi:hypothetical protein